MRRVYLLILVVALSNCRKLISVPSPQNQVTAASVFSSDAGAEEALSGLYIQVMTGLRPLLNGGMTLYGGLSADELNTTVPNPFILPFQTNQLTSGNVYCSLLYSSAYQVIFTANSLLVNLNASTAVSPAVKAELRGEAEVVRALEYFYL